MICFDEFYTLSVDVEDGTTGGGASICSLDAFGGDVGDGFGGGAVAIAAELGVLEEGTLLNEVFKFLLGDVVIGLTSDLAWSGISRSVCESVEETKEERPGRRRSVSFIDAMSAERTGR